jgi:hypothetical protein
MLMIDKLTGTTATARRAEVDFNATYSFAGTPLRRSRVHGISAWSVRICTVEQLALRRSILVNIELASGWVRLPGNVLMLAAQDGNLSSYEIKVDEELLRSKIGSVESLRIREERRPAMRVCVDIAAAYTCKGRSFDGAQVIEVSTSGLRLRTRESLSVLSMLEIELRIPGGRPARVSGQVVRLVDNVGDRLEYGVKLIVDPAARDTLRRMVLAASVTARSSGMVVVDAVRRVV